MNKGRIIIRLSSLNARGCYLLAIFIIGFSLLQSTGLAFLQADRGPGILESAACLILLNLGYVVSSTHNDKRPGLLRILIECVVIPSTASLLALLLAPGLILGVYLALFSIIFYFAGYRSGITEVYSILSTKRIYFGISILAVLLILSKHAVSFRSHFPAIAGLTACFSITAIIISNQRTLDYNIYVKRGVDASGVQKNLRSYNIKILFLTMLFIVLLFNAKKIVIKLYSIALFITGWGIYYFFHLLTLLTPGREEEGPANGGMGPQDMMLPEADGGNSLVPLILTIIVAIIVVAVAIWALPRLARAFAEKTKLIWNKFIRFLRNFFTIKEKELKLEFEEFTDHVEIIRETHGSRNAKRKPRTMRRSLKHINDPILKIRYIYRTIIYSYKDILKISKSDTAGEILKKSQKLGSIAGEFGEITDMYEKARYGGMAPSEEGLKQSEAFVNRSLK